MRTIDKKPTDWAAIKAGWMLGSPSIRALARHFGVSDTAIRKQARLEGWPSRTANREPEREPARTSRTEGREKPSPAAPDFPSSIEVAADADPKEMAKGGRALLAELLAELRSVARHADIIERIIEEETQGDRSPRRRALLLRIVSLPTRIQASRNLMSAIAMAAEAGPGKKAQAAEDAAAAAATDDDWGSDLSPTARQMQATVN